jgi:hypothetical protein
MGSFNNLLRQLFNPFHIFFIFMQFITQHTNKMTHTRRFRSKKNRTMKKRHMKNKTRRGGVPDQYGRVVSHAPGHMPKNRPSYYHSYKAPYLPKDHGVIHVEEGHANYVAPKPHPSAIARTISKIGSKIGDFAGNIAYNLTKKHNIQNIRAKERDTILREHNAHLMRESGIHKK